MDQTGFSRSFLAPLLAIAGISVMADDSLYNYVEVRPIDESLVRIEFTVHLAELVPGIDPNTTDLSWTETLTDAEIENLLEEAGQFVATTFPCPIPPISFPNTATFRAMARDSGAPRPGCIVATATLSRDRSSLPMTYSKNAPKRLMLVTTKPGVFPEVRDIAPGEHFEISLR